MIPVFVVMSLALAGVAGPAHAAYQLEELVKLTDGFTHISQVAINNAGTVVFVADDPASPGRSALFSGPDPSADRLPLGFVTAIPNGRIGLNDLNMVSFYGVFNGHDGIYTVPVRASNPSAVKLTSNPSFVMEGSLFGSTSINNSGTVVFHAQVGSSPGSSRNGLFVGPDPVNDALVLGGNDLPDVEPSPRINNGGTVVFGGENHLLYPGVFTRNKGGPITEIASRPQFTTPNVPHFYSFASWDINDSGRVAFLAMLDGAGGINGIFTGPDPAADAFVKTTTPSFPGTGYLSIDSFAMNDNGTIVFSGSPNAPGAQQFGVYAGPDRVADKIMEFAGARISLIPGGLNDHGDLVFAYTAGNGQSGVIEVHGVPEPGSLPALLAAGLVSLRRRRLGTWKF